MGKPIRSITVVGGGTSGWIAAAYLARAFAGPVQRRELTITLIESPKIGIIGVGESTARPISGLLRFLGVKESEFIRRCNATFKMGGWFQDWDFDENGNGVSWVNPFFTQTDISGLNPASLYASYAMHEGGGPVGEDYTEAMSICPAIIRAHKGPRPIAAGDYQSEVPYSYHMDAIELAKILMERGKALGVRQILDNVTNVRLDERGFVEALDLEENGEHKVEFIIDATGFAAIIIGKAMGEPFEPYDRFLLNDRAAVAQIPHEDPAKIEATSRATALGAGWAFRVPLFNRVGSGYVYSSRFISDDEAIAEFRAHAGPAAAAADPRVIRMRIGKARRSLVKNCLALGLSSGFVEPLEATAIYSVQVALQWLISYFPDTDFDESVERRYNGLIDGLYSEIVDFISLLFHVSNRADTPYWQTVANDLEVPDSLAENLELWRHSMPNDEDFRTNTFFTPTSYRAALMGKRFYKGRRWPQADMLPKKFWDDYIAQRRVRTQKFLQGLPDHVALLKSIRGEGPQRYSFGLQGTVSTGRV